MITEPMLKSTPTMRNYEDYKYQQAYTEGWNSAMEFIFAKELIEIRRSQLKLGEADA